MLYPASRRQQQALAVIRRCHNIRRQLRKRATKFLTAFFAVPIILRSSKTRACSAFCAFGRGAEKQGGVAT